MSWDGRSDRPQKAIATVTVSSSVTGTQAVTFTPPFSTTPIVTGLAVVGTNAYAASVPSGLNASGMTIGVRHIDGTSQSATVFVHWSVEV